VSKISVYDKIAMLKPEKREKIVTR